MDDVSIVAAPGASAYADRDAIALALISHAEKRRSYRIAVLDTNRDLPPGGAKTVKAQLDSKYAALYYPWVVAANPLARPDKPEVPKEVKLPPSGFVCGIYARSDIERGVFKAPANEVVRGALRFERLVSTGEQELLNPLGINCLRLFPGRGNRVWGARTISSDPEWKYVNVRRYFNYLEHSLDNGTQRAVFEPNGEKLWANVRDTVASFLYNEWVNGALLGDKPELAFFVRCDRGTMTQNDLDNGRLICLIGVAVIKPAEFVIFPIGQKTADAAPNRADVVCFLVFVARRTRPGDGRLTALGPEMKRWLADQGWRAETALIPDDDLLQTPVPIESFEEFARLFAWEAREPAAAAPGLATWLGAAVRSFFVQGGSRCLVVRAGDPWAYVAPRPGRSTAAITAADQARRQRLKLLVPHFGGGVMPRANDAASWVYADALRRPQWQGLGILHGAAEAAVLCLPDLPELVADTTHDPKVIREGGLNYGAHQRAGTTTFATVILRRGITANADLWRWFELTTRGGGYAYRMDVDIEHLDVDGTRVRAWHLGRALPVKFKSGDLNARGGEVAVEELHLVHEGLSLRT